MKEIVIVGAKRSPIGSLMGSLSTLSAVELGRQVVGDLLAHTNVDATQIDELIAGQVLTTGAGQNPARQVAIQVGMRQESLAMTINQVCGSGLRAVMLGMQSITSGLSEIVVAGGQESMSNAPHYQYLRGGIKMGDSAATDTILRDGLLDAFDNQLMGVTAERLADKLAISRAAQDAFALRSQQLAQQAIVAGHFNTQITPIQVQYKKQTQQVDADEHPRFDLTMAALEKLTPAFMPNGSVTAGNASGVNDGAAYVLMMSAAKAKALNLSPMAVIRSIGVCGVNPAEMGYGPVPASQQALINAGWTVDALDLIEANEAFAAQALAVNHGMQWDVNKVNVTGGAIALGHPIGASGARILVTLLYNMQRLHQKRGLATLCVGGGQGVALCVERCVERPAVD
ncbi:acetyl-CoA C-acetyltransferase [Ostreibacterium oceani]|uniref:Acetyl-CoA C-acyltransferase n=1 Tax=Ostreibacterium oceani TaxID=2654998 RepID=A0A6N7F190_9GAMM|nr:acetyl-CoA C-acetyltransferase [Ostreibacterium oceani]MPV86558.1 acetyl-CoA C-acyltransferase [Ostreibacterium oceani]